MFCAKCGKELAEGAQFCGNCGWAFARGETQTAPQPPAEQPAPPRCVQCGALLKEGAVFCGECGAKAGTMQAAPSWVVNVPVSAPTTQLPPPTKANRLMDNNLKSLMILSIAAPVIYVVYLIILIQFFSGDMYGNAVLLYGCLLAQGITAFIKSIKYKNTPLIIAAIIGVLWYAFCIVHNFFIPDAGIFYIIRESFDVLQGAYSSTYSSTESIVLLFYAIILYPIIFCVLTAVWCMAKKE
jgi:hypothetical protein